MEQTLQPIVAVRQQLIRAIGRYTMQPMVAIAKSAEKEAFAERLNKAYDRLAGAPRRGRRASWLVKELARREGSRVVSIEAARKWLSGESMPDQTHMAMLARHAEIDVNLLHSGEPSRVRSAGVREPQTTYHGVIVSHEGALLGADWDQLPAPFKEATQVQIHLLVAAHKRGDLARAMKSRERKGADKRRRRGDPPGDVAN